ncbi:MAG: universal stress protein [Streptosporangiaceae bacterium]|jgi:nucleotide-binding universal stress UspA family protein|nr:hypothetical protein [Actinomycetota bacterium]
MPAMPAAGPGDTAGPVLMADEPSPDAGDVVLPAMSERVVVGIDDSPAGLAALRWAVRAAREADLQLVAVRSWALGLPRHGGLRRHRALIHPHVVLYFDGSEQCDASTQIVRKAFRIVAGGVPRDITVTVQTPEGVPGPALTSVAGSAGDVIVVGDDSGVSLKHLLHGSVSRYCSEHAHCPVVVIPAPAAGDAKDGS